MTKEFENYRAAMMNREPTITRMIDRGDGTCLIVKRLLFHWTLLVSDIGDYCSYTDRYCYANQWAAQDAAEAWIKSGSKEPEGWHRHHKTGRRRPGGDATKEYIAH